MASESKVTFSNDVGNKLTGLLVTPASWTTADGAPSAASGACEAAPNGGRRKVIVLLHGQCETHTGPARWGILCCIPIAHRRNRVSFKRVCVLLLWCAACSIRIPGQRPGLLWVCV